MLTYDPIKSVVTSSHTSKAAQPELPFIPEVSITPLQRQHKPTQQIYKCCVQLWEVSVTLTACPCGHLLMSRTNPAPIRYTAL